MLDNTLSVHKLPIVGMAYLTWRCDGTCQKANKKQKLPLSATWYNIMRMHIVENDQLGT